MAVRPHGSLVPVVALLLLACGLHVASGLFYDVLQPHQVPAPGVTCLDWAEAGAEVDNRWASGVAPANAANHCAQQGKGAAVSTWSTVHTPGQPKGQPAPMSYCIDRATHNVSFCHSVMGVPEQTNVQIASPNSVVVGFVTFEADAPTRPPVALLSTVGEPGGGTTRLTGVTHAHETGGGRIYYMHYVGLGNLTSRGRYSYQVMSGGEEASLSDNFTFRAPYSGADGGATRIALFGDMGARPCWPADLGAAVLQHEQILLTCACAACCRCLQRQQYGESL